MPCKLRGAVGTLTLCAPEPCLVRFTSESGGTLSHVARADSVTACSFKSPGLRIPTSIDRMTDHYVRQPCRVLTSFANSDLDRRGNRQLVAVCAANLVLYLLVKSYYTMRNHQKEKKWRALSNEVSNLSSATAVQSDCCLFT